MSFTSKLLACVAAVGLSGLALGAPMTIDTQKSEIEWIGKKVSGEHNGTLMLESGKFDLDKGTGNFVIDMKSINNKDLDGEWKQKLEGHLKSDDFFNVEKYPQAKFVLKKATKQKDGKYKMTGDLTVKGITKPVEFDATMEEKDKMKWLMADFQIDRLKWDIKYNSGKFFDVKKLGDKMIYDDIGIKLKLATK